MVAMPSRFNQIQPAWRDPREPAAGTATLLGRAVDSTGADRSRQGSMRSLITNVNRRKGVCKEIRRQNPKAENSFFGLHPPWGGATSGAQELCVISLNDTGGRSQIAAPRRGALRRRGISFLVCSVALPAAGSGLFSVQSSKSSDERGSDRF